MVFDLCFTHSLCKFQMLKAILQAHSKNPLTDTELKNYIWLDNIADRENLVSQITNKRNTKFFRKN